MKKSEPTDWNTTPFPSKRSVISLDRTFSTQEMILIRNGLVPEQMEDKWFVYWQDDALYFHRSWTGFCIYVVRFEVDDERGRMVEAEVNRDREQYSVTSDAFEAKMISYLTDVLLLHQAAEFPSDDSCDDDTNIIRNWSQVGRAMLGEHPGDDE